MDASHFRSVIVEKSDLELIPIYFMRAEYNPTFVEELLPAVDARLDLKEAIAHAESIENLTREQRIADAEGFYIAKHPQPPARTYDEEVIHEIMERSPNKNLLPPDQHPNLITLNGCGVRFVGRFNENEDVYDTIRWITLLWIPVLPIDSYRVTKISSNEYLIHEKIQMDRSQVSKHYLILVLVLSVFAMLILASS